MNRIKIKTGRIIDCLTIYVLLFIQKKMRSYEVSSYSGVTLNPMNRLDSANVPGTT